MAAKKASSKKTTTSPSTTPAQVKGKVKEAKLPASLKAAVYANVVAASEDLIVAGCDSATNLTVWSAKTGRVVTIDKPIEEKAEFRACPAKAGLATLPNDRFVMAAGPHNNNDQKTKFPSLVGVFGLDGALVGGPRALYTEAEGQKFGATATSPNGELVAVASSTGVKAKVMLWRTDDLIAGGKPMRVFPNCWAAALAFTPDGESIVFVTQNELSIVPAKASGGSVKEISVELEAQTGEVVSVSEKGTICVSDSSSASVLTLDGKRLFDFPGPERGEKRVCIVEQAMVTADGTVIGVAGDPFKHWSKDLVASLKITKEDTKAGFVGVFDGKKGTILSVHPRTKNKPVRAMALAPNRAVVIGQDGAAELAPWPL